MHELDRLNLVLRAVDRQQMREANEGRDVSNVILRQVDVLNEFVLGQIA